MASVTLFTADEARDGGTWSPLHYGRTMFVALWSFIIIVSVIDGYLVLEHREVLVELNPQGRWLIALNGGEVWGLLAAKFAGTVAACTVLRIIYLNSVRVGITVASAIAVLQFCLLMFWWLFQLQPIGDLLDITVSIDHGQGDVAGH